MESGEGGGGVAPTGTWSFSLLLKDSKKQMTGREKGYGEWTETGDNREKPWHGLGASFTEDESRSYLFHQHGYTISNIHTSVWPMIMIKYKQNKKMIFGAWNVHLDRDASSRPKRRTSIIMRELCRYQIDIATLVKDVLPKRQAHPAGRLQCESGYRLQQLERRTWTSWHREA